MVESWVGAAHHSWSTQKFAWCCVKLLALVSVSWSASTDLPAAVGWRDVLAAKVVWEGESLFTWVEMDMHHPLYGPAVQAGK